MKKIMIAVLLCLVGAGAHAQSASADYIGRHGADIDAAKEDAVHKGIDRKAALSALRVGKYLFTLEQEESFNDNGEIAYNYFYRPKRPAVFREAVLIDINTQRPLVSAFSVAHRRLLGPISSKDETYEISEIEVTIYPTNRLAALEQSWKQQFGRECVSHYKKSLGRPTDLVVMKHTPTGAFLTKDNETVVVSANASSENFGAYRQDCSTSARGELYEKVEQTISQLQRALSK